MSRQYCTAPYDMMTRIRESKEKCVGLTQGARARRTPQAMRLCFTRGSHSGCVVEFQLRARSITLGLEVTLDDFSVSPSPASDRQLEVYARFKRIGIQF